MARLIDGEKLKNEVASTFHGAIGLTVTGAVHEIIDRQPAIDPESLRPEWISVKDRLPEKNKDVLIFTELGKMAVAFYEGGIYWYLYAGDDGEGGYEPSGEKITHWAQLPKPPEGFEYSEGWLPIAHYTYHGN